jgi:mannose-1-phosphate guanylyltransferase
MQHNYVVIMAGGIGSRFWPFSRSTNPKQFHDVLGNGQSLLQQTAARFDEICPPENIYIVTSAEYEGLVREQLPFLSADQILLEPTRRNTAPCIGYACYKIASRDPQANVVIAPADHVIQYVDEFVRVVKVAMDATEEQDILMTLGITPSRPDTGYGYIQYVPNPRQAVKKVRRFTEKPPLAQARQFVESGEFVWNAGIFAWNVQALKRAFAQHLPDLHEVFSAGEATYYTDQEADFVSKAYTTCRGISIDNGLMEPADNVHVVLSNFGWSDLGTWKSLYDVSEKDENQNVTDGEILLYETRNCIIKTPKERLVTVQGLDGYIVAEYDNVLLICRIDEEQRVKEFVAEAQQRGQEFV